ncbi:hypothetical protein [uncultured Jannaschia sp.]|uniref:FitA-like ribbon-helix-helix domain-containing protein n=1 Tax=uncultured Jannaschia sp. TaxID=293347 RepID=UPI00261E08D5|nr:hypothetical protein [uncultured Jannaschia sp.]
MTIRNVDPAVKAALEARARAESISQSEAARRALARGLGVKIPRRDLGGLGAELLDPAPRAALGRIDWTAPAFTDAELDAMMAEETTRSGTDRDPAKT